MGSQGDGLASAFHSTGSLAAVDISTLYSRILPEDSTVACIFYDLFSCFSNKKLKAEERS